MKEFYEMFGISEESTVEEIEVAYSAYKEGLKAKYDAGELTDSEYLEEFQKAYDAYIGVKTYRVSRDEEAARIEAENRGEACRRESGLREAPPRKVHGGSGGDRSREGRVREEGEGGQQKDQVKLP